MYTVHSEVSVALVQRAIWQVKFCGKREPGITRLWLLRRYVCPMVKYFSLPVMVQEGMVLQLSGPGPRFEVDELSDYLPKDGLASEQQTPVVFEGHLLGILPKDAGPLRNQLVCVNPDNFNEMVWSSGPETRFGLGPYMIADGKLFILNDDGTLIIVKPSTREYVELDRYQVIDGHDAWGPLAVADGYMVLRDAKTMICLDLAANRRETTKKDQMKKRGLTIVVLVIVLVIITVIVVDFLNNRPDRRSANPYALEIEHFKDVDPQLISHKETRNLSLGSLKGSALNILGRETVCGGRFIPGDHGARWFFDRKDLRLIPDPIMPSGGQEAVFVGYKSYVAQYDREMELVKRWGDLGERAVITNLAGNGEKVYVADAGNRKVTIYNQEGEVLGAFEGKSESEAGHGFIVPSANFDLAVNDFGELWVVNPGKHAMENYSDDGRMRGFWENASFDIDGFLGCCNPARITVMDDGSFVTSEKGMVRIKIYDQSGQLLSVVAPPDLI